MVNLSLMKPIYLPLVYGEIQVKEKVKWLHKDTNMKSGGGTFYRTIEISTQNTV